MSSRLYSQDDDDVEIMQPLSPTSNGMTMTNGGVSRRRDENRKNQSNNDVRRDDK